jgi:hypothetical protein
MILLVAAPQSKKNQTKGLFFNLIAAKIHFSKNRQPGSPVKNKENSLLRRQKGFRNEQKDQHNAVP